MTKRAVAILAGIALMTAPIRALAAIGFLSPTMEATLLQVTTANHATPLRPLFSGELGVTLGNWNTLGIEAASTSDFLNSNLNPNSIYYSNIGFFYRYRFIGGPVRAPQFPLNPQYGPIRFKRNPITEAAYGPALNMDIGARVYFSALRGQGDAVVDPELARSYQGFALTFGFDRRISDFRLRAQAEGGYTLLRGKMVTGGIGGGITYDKWPQVSPGLTCHYSFVSGQALGGDGSMADVSNQLASFGTILIFKM